MRFAAVIALLLGCGGAPASPPANTPAPKVVRELYCPQGAPKQSGLAVKDPAEGGYRRLPDDVALQSLRGAIATSTGTVMIPRERMFTALDAAFHDLVGELRACMSRADPVKPNLQYVVQLALRGNAAGTVVEEARVKRIVATDAAHPDGMAETNAEVCIAGLLQLLELPPSAHMSGMSRVLRYDDCVPAYDVGRTIAQTYARAFPAWLAAHPEAQCPARLEELHPHMAAMKETVDPWGAPFQLRCRSGRLEVWSAGRDRREGTDDDVTSWE